MDVFGIGTDAAGGMCPNRVAHFGERNLNETSNATRKIRAGFSPMDGEF
jgi:hypothetical protein